MRTAVEQAWQDSVLPSLSELVRIPAVSPAYDAEWESAGQLDAAIAHVQEWITAREIPGVRLDVVRLPERTPLLLVDVPATEPVPEAGSQDTVLLYGHLDKQPPMHGWRDGLGPWTPVVYGDRLYGRGGADYGYAAYASLAAIEAVQAEGGRHARCVGLI